MGKAASMDYAKQLYLYGGPDGRRITSNVKLAELTGLLPDSISKAKNRDNWDAELEGLSRSLELRPSNKGAMIAKIEAKGVKLCQHLSKIDETLRQLTPDDPEYTDLLNLQLKISKELERYDGVTRFLEVELVYAKELAKHRAKIDAARLADNSPKPALGRDVTPDGGVPLT